MMQKLRQLREKVGERFDELQEKVRAQWMEFNPREKLIVSVLAGVMGLLVFALVAKETTSLFSRVSSEAENNYKNIEKIQSLMKDLQLQQTDLSRFIRLREKRGENFKLQGFVESEAVKFGTVVSKVAPTRALDDSGKEIKTEEWIEVHLKDASLDSMLKFLSSIEDTLGLRIVNLKVNTQFADPTKLDLITVIASTTTL